VNSPHKASLVDPTSAISNCEIRLGNILLIWVEKGGAYPYQFGFRMRANICSNYTEKSLNKQSQTLDGSVEKFA
jgi:hypothetical protein